jgi:hypothetical protein
MKQHTYEISVTPVTHAQGEAVKAAPLVFSARNHDDLFAIVERIKSRGLLNNDDSAAFAVGLKLFSEIILENRDQPFFKELSAPMGEMMKMIKSHKPSV